MCSEVLFQTELTPLIAETIFYRKAIVRANSEISFSFSQRLIRKERHAFSSKSLKRVSMDSESTDLVSALATSIADIMCQSLVDS